MYIYIYGYIYIWIYMDTSTDARRHTQRRFIHLQTQVYTHIDVLNTGSAWPAGRPLFRDRQAVAVCTSQV